MSIFSAGEKLAEMAFNYASKPITYKRNNVAIATDIPAKIGKTLFLTEDISTGFSVRYEQRDFIVCTSALNTTPKNGDIIVFDGKQYMVSAPTGEPAWRWHSKQSHLQLRIHTKFID